MAFVERYATTPGARTAAVSPIATANSAGLPGDQGLPRPERFYADATAGTRSWRGRPLR